jgi:hypothetical protein
MRHRATAAVVAALLAVVMAVPVTAAPAQPVQIDLHVVFLDNGGSMETFTADGLCESGTTESFGFHQAGRGRATTFHLFKTLTCDGTGDTLTIRVEVAFVFGTTGTIGGWNVVDGTGDFERTRGGGSIVGVSFEGGIDDTYTGFLTQ